MWARQVMVLARDQGFAPLAWLYAFKARATRTRVIVRTLRVPESQASLLTGILLGDDAANCRGIPKSVLLSSQGVRGRCPLSSLQESNCHTLRTVQR